MEDHEAITRLKRGDIAGLESLVRAHYLAAVRAAYLVVREREVAEDIVQTAFLRAYERIGQFDSARPFAPWFLRGVINDAVKAATRRGRQQSLDEPPGSGATALSNLLVDPAPGPEDAAEHAERRRQVWAALGSLPPKQRAAVVLRYYVGMSEAEVAEHLHCTPGAAKWRLHAARTRLRALLEPWWHAARGTMPGKASAD